MCPRSGEGLANAAKGKALEPKGGLWGSGHSLPGTPSAGEPRSPKHNAKGMNERLLKAHPYR